MARRTCFAPLVPRPPRIQSSETLFHLTTRSVRRTPLFRDDTDRWMFFAIVDSVVARHNWICHAYCLMTTHYHLVIRTTDDSELALAMHRLNGLYARTFNRRHDERGHVFDARYTSTLIESDSHLLEACRYVELNPVRAGLCMFAEDWPWSSYAAALGLRPAPPFFDPVDLLTLFHHRIDLARAAYRRFVEDEALAA